MIVVAPHGVATIVTNYLLPSAKIAFLLSMPRAGVSRLDEDSIENQPH